MPKSATNSSRNAFLSFSRHLFRHPAFLLGLMGMLLTLLVLPVPPTLMVSDSLARMRDAHWIWSGENPGGPLPGIHGMGHHWYGLGQTLLFIPPDYLLTHLGLTDEKIRSSATALVVFPFLNGCLLALGWIASRHLGFAPRTSVLNILILIPCTTLLWHLQNNQENTFILALAFVAIIGLIRWEQSGSILWLHIACAAQAWNCLVRLPNLALVLPLFLLPWLTRILKRPPTNPIEAFRTFTTKDTPTIALAAFPWFLLAALMDRLWQRLRFGNWTGTYMSEFKRFAHETYLNLPTDFPFHVPFMEGFTGFFLAPGKSVVLYESLIIPTILLVWLNRKRLPPASLAIVLLGVISLIGHAVGLARYAFWHAEPNWGPRFLATPAHLIQLPAGALLLVILVQTYTHSAIKWLTRTLLGALAIVSVSSLWMPAYFEMTEHNLATFDFELADPSSTPSTPLPSIQLAQDWRFFNRPQEVAHDLVTGWSGRQPVPGESRPQRMLLPAQPLASLPIAIRLALRTAWWLGLGFTICLAIRAWQLSDNSVPVPGSDDSSEKADT